jgi:transposase, IS605 orfB family
MSKFVLRTERHVITKNDKNYNNIKELCHRCKNLYNYCNYILRQSFFRGEGLPGKFDLMGLLAKENQDDYRALSAQTAQQIIQLLYRNWKSYFQSLKSYQKDKSKFNGRPRIPKYKPRGEKGHYVAFFTNQQIKLNNGEIVFPKLVKLKPIRTKASSIEQVRIVPASACFIVEVVYEKEIIPAETIDGSVASIDLGINNFVTFLDNQGYQPFIINGKGAKAYNQYYHKEKARLQSELKQGKYYSKNIQLLGLRRANFMQNFLHQSSSIVIKALKERKISTLVIGLNEDWKQKTNIGKANNQNFLSLPHRKLIDQLVYKCEEVGIEVILTEEAYTSKIDHFVEEPMCRQAKYLGKRIHRGLFRSSTGILINADLNGALGIMRKVFPEKALAIAELIRNSGVAFTPIIVHPINCHKVNTMALGNRIRMSTMKKAS